jgi:Gametolysin peptidase M11
MRSSRRATAAALVVTGALAIVIPTAQGASVARHTRTPAASTTRTLSAPLAITPLLHRLTIPSTGTIRVLLVPIGWSGASQVQTGARLEAMLAGVAAYYGSISQGRLAITGDVAAAVVLPGPALAGRGLADADVDDALRAAGVDPAAYDRVVYAYPHLSDADWNGQADIGVDAPGQWVDLNGDEPTSQLAHELGHTFGLVHAHGYHCSRGVLTGRCTLDEYGDATDLMGSGSNAETSTFGAIERYQLGWLTHVAGVDATGVYQLGPIDAPDSGPLPRALVIETSRGELWVERAVERGTFFVHLAHSSAIDWGSRLLEAGENQGVFSAASPFVAAGVSITPVAAADGVLSLAITFARR